MRFNEKQKNQRSTHISKWPTKNGKNNAKKKGFLECFIINTSSSGNLLPSSKTHLQFKKVLENSKKSSKRFTKAFQQSIRASWSTTTVTENMPKALKEQQRSCVFRTSGKGWRLIASFKMPWYYLHISTRFKNLPPDWGKVYAQNTQVEISLRPNGQTWWAGEPVQTGS